MVADRQEGTPKAGGSATVWSHIRVYLPAEV
jgi:hypothetical protein